VSIMKRQAMRSVQEDKKKKVPSKKRKIANEGESSQSGPKSVVPKRQKSSKIGCADKRTSVPPKQAPETPSTSSIGVTEILEVMTRPLPFTMPSPVGSDLTSLLQTKNKNAEEEIGRGPSGTAMEETVNTSEDQVLRKKRYIKTVMKAMCKAPPSEAKKKVPVSEADKPTDAVEGTKDSGVHLGLPYLKLIGLLRM
jgi:hypothetical protein